MILFDFLIYFDLTFIIFFLGFASVNSAQSDLNVATSLPPLGNDPASVQWRKQTLDINKQNVVSQVSAHLAATAAILNLTSVDPAKMDYNQIGSNVSTISSNLAQLASGTKMIAALMEDAEESEKLLEAARKLASATSKMLTESQPIIMGQGNRQELLASAQGIGGASSQMLKVFFFSFFFFNPFLEHKGNKIKIKIKKISIWEILMFQWLLNKN